MKHVYPHSSAGKNGRGDQGFSKKKVMHGEHGSRGHKVMKSSMGPSVYHGDMRSVRDPNVPHQNGKAGC